MIMKLTRPTGDGGCGGTKLALFALLLKGMVVLVGEKAGEVIMEGDLPTTSPAVTVILDECVVPSFRLLSAPALYKRMPFTN